MPIPPRRETPATRNPLPASRRFSRNGVPTLNMHSHTLPGPIRTAADKMRRGNLLLLVLVLALMSAGIAFIYGSGHQSGVLAGHWSRQTAWAVLGLLAMATLALFDYEVLGRHAVWIYIGSIVLLIAVLALGNDPVSGSKMRLRIVPEINVQPAEFAKLGLLIPLAWAASRPFIRLERPRYIVPFLALAAIPVVLISRQPDLGSALVLIPMTAAVLFASGLPLRWLLVPMAAGMILLPSYYELNDYCLKLAPDDPPVEFSASRPPGKKKTQKRPVICRLCLKKYQFDRLKTFIHPSTNPTGSGWNALQSLLAVGSGGLYGKGYMKGTQNVLGFLPWTVAPTDFIFSVIAEETGFVGSSLIVVAFSALLILCIFIAAKARDDFGRNLACGIAVMFGCHIYINIGMTMGMAPIIGIPLPFVSYGGSFMILSLSCVGILQSVYIHRRS